MDQAELTLAPPVTLSATPSADTSDQSTRTIQLSRPRQPELVYALGKIGYDLVSRSRRDSFKQKMDAAANPEEPQDLLRYLDTYPYEASFIQWTLELDGTPIYAIEPRDAFARDAFELLRQFLREELTEGVERVSIPGVIAGMVRMRSGLEVPIVVPVIRGLYSWTTQSLVTAVSGSAPGQRASRQAREQYEAKRGAVMNFLERVYYELRNLGRAPRERALNFAATNAFEVAKIFEIAIREDMELDTIDVERSPVCPPGADYWDVKLAFFFPQRPAQAVRRMHRLTVDVADVVPATIGPVRSWFARS
jgi:cyanobactin maturation PatA/PatG family protease